MDSGTKYLLGSGLRALHAKNAVKPIAREGFGSIPSFAYGLPASELPLQHMALYAGSTLYALGRGAHKTLAGKLGLAVTAGAAATLYGIHSRMDDGQDIVDRALVDELGEDYRDRMAPAPAVAKRPSINLLPTKAVRARYVTDGHIAYGDAGPRTTLDVWRRPDLPLDGSAPVIVQVHGGAWVVGDKNQQAFPLMTHLAERGWICVSITYRLSPRSAWPDHIVDVKQALAWVKQNIADYGGDPRWVAITGGSAGGHLSSLAALTPNDPQFQPGFEDADTSVAAAVPFYGVYDWTNRDGSGRSDIEEFLEEYVTKTTLEESPELFEQASPMTHVGPDAPPCFFLHGVNDSLVPVEQARSMVDLMRKESTNPVVYAEFPDAQHAWEIFGSKRTAATVRAVEEFLNVCRADAGAAEPA